MDQIKLIREAMSILGKRKSARKKASSRANLEKAREGRDRKSAERAKARATGKTLMELHAEGRL
jgi:hypothetical protein